MPKTISKGRSATSFDPSATVPELERAQIEISERHLESSTRSNYNRTIQLWKTFVDEENDRRKNIATRSLLLAINGKPDPASAPSIIKADFVSDEFPSLINQFLTKVVVHKNLSVSSLEQRYSGLKNYFKKLKNCGDEAFILDNNGSYLRGNPCNAVQVQNFLDGATKTLQEGRVIKSSMPFLYQNFQLMESCFRRTSDFSFVEVLFIRAFFSLSWYCMLRVDEVCSLKFKDFDFNIFEQNQDGHSIVYHKLKLSKRKTNSDITKSQIWQIHSVPGEEAADCYKFIDDWRKYLFDNNDQSKGINTEPDAFFFKGIRARSNEFLVAASPGDNNPTLKTSDIYSLINRVSRSCSFESFGSATYTAHCFRRGGAQHRFFYARQTWPLTVLRYWGGWSNDENPNTIIRYLMDEYIAMEGDFSDYLSPFRRDRNYNIAQSSIDSVNESNFVSNRLLLNEMTTVKNQNREIKVLLESISIRTDQVSTEAPATTVTRGRPRAQPINETETVFPIPNCKGWKEMVEAWHRGINGCRAIKVLTAEQRNMIGPYSSDKDKRARRTKISKLKTIGEEYEYQEMIREGNFEAVYSGYLHNTEKLLSKIRSSKATRTRLIDNN